MAIKKSRILTLESWGQPDVSADLWPVSSTPLSSGWGGEGGKGEGADYVGWRAGDGGSW